MSRILTFFLSLSKVHLQDCPLSGGGTDCESRASSSNGDIKKLNQSFTNKIQNKMAELKIKPLADRVVVEPAEAEQKTASGIIIPDTAKEKPQRGTVVAVGNGKKDEPMTVKTGDVVLYGKYSGTEIEIDGRKVLIMKESDIFAIV
jgi:chaperonin GroES